jgi:hypothetical protein
LGEEKQKKKKRKRQLTVLKQEEIQAESLPALVEVLEELGKEGKLQIQRSFMPEF